MLGVFKTAVIAAGAICLFALPSRSLAQLYMDSGSSNQVEQVQGAQIDWGSEFYYATGEGAMASYEEESNRFKAFVKAKGYGKTKAIANLLMAVEGTPFTCKTVARDFLSKEDTLKQAIDELAANVEIVSERQKTDGSDTTVIVTVRAPMYGSRGLGSSIIKSRSVQDAVSDVSANGINLDKRADITVATISTDAKGPFTSIIVDCSGLAIQRAMYPRLRKSDGTVIGPGVDYGSLGDHGIVTYARSLYDAKRKDITGTNPIIIHAAGKAGDRFHCDAILSDPDAERVLAEEEASQSLKKSKLVFIVDAE